MAVIMITALQSQAQENYDVSKISPALLQNANVVVRMEDQVYEVKSPGSAVMEYKTAITILNKSGENASNMAEYYDKFSNIYNLKATIYDAKGVKIKDFRSSDFKDRSAVSGGSLYEDSRIKFIEFLHTSFPYTIAYSYSVDYSGIRSYPSWNPAPAWAYAVEQSSYTFRIPKSMTFKYLSSPNLKVDSVAVKDKMQYKWSCTALPAIEREPLSTGLKNINPWVTLAPNQFEYDNSKANIQNWTTMGSWMYELSNGGQTLTEPVKAKIQALVKDAASPKEKIRILYNYLQQNTRYVGVQLGIGGYKPISAEKVSAVNYGDCKGLSNYMKAMLEQAGINAELVVIGNGMPSLNRQFASMNQANHMILCVPLEKDTTWLECTSHFTPPGYIGNDNSGKTVLLVTEKGGKLVETPIYTAESNSQKRKTKVDFKSEGAADIQIETQYANAQFEGRLGMMLMEPTEQRKVLLNALSIPNLELTAVNYTFPDKSQPVIQEKISGKSTQLLTGGGGKLFITLNMLNRQESALAPLENRKTPFSLDYAYQDVDEITYTIPTGYKVEFLPKDIAIESEFGKYTASVVAKDNTLVYTRIKTIKNKKYPAEKYNEYVAFAKKMYQADKQKGVLAKID